MDKEEIKNWLSRIGKDRAWLADQVGCTLGTLNQWFSKMGFPEWALKSIHRLMNPEKNTAGLEVSFTSAEFERIEKARDLSGHATRAEYYKTAITEFTDQILKAEAKSKAPTVIQGPFPGTSSPSNGADDHGLKAAAEG